MNCLACVASTGDNTNGNAYDGCNKRYPNVGHENCLNDVHKILLFTESNVGDYVSPYLLLSIVAFQDETAMKQNCNFFNPQFQSNSAVALLIAIINDERCEQL
jgi:hypothetical protein